MDQSLAQLLAQNFTAPEAEILTADEATKQFGSTTFSSPVNIDSAVVVKQRSAINKLLILANQHQFHIHPVSSNNNWGYGSIPKSNTDKPLALLDLSSLNQIHMDDPELGLVTIEPGVTQQALSDFIEEQNLPFMVPVTGAGPSCSIVSNALERGYGITPHTDHFYACTALKAIIPHPNMCHDEYCSAVNEWDESQVPFVDKTFKWGIGPYVDGLFTQSNFAIVTEMTFRLALKPAHFCAFYIQVPSHDLFADAIHFIRNTLQIHSGNVGSINLMDRRRLLSMTVDNPNLEKSQDTYLSQQQVETLAKQKGLPEWMIVGSIYGTQATVKAVKRDLKRSGKRLGRMLCSDDWLLKTANLVTQLPLNFVPAFNSISKQIDSLNEGIEIMLGKPNQVALPLPYWRNRVCSANKSRTMNPATDKCGLLWYAPLVKMNAVELDKFVSFVRTTIHSFDLDPFITFTNLRHDCIDATVPIVFDLNNAEETSRAHACFDQIINDGKKLGFVPYRLPTTHHHKLFSDSPFWKVVQALKAAIDPNQVITPGKYSPELQSRMDQ